MARPSNQPPDPTPDEIRAECEKIRSGWSDDEYRKRAGLGPPDAWMPPEVSVSDETPFFQRGKRK